ncbi:MAG: hypothetical protein LBH05_06715 [Deferribacteraceae bacterium]|jgi:hypothetical protein|nr:hypothetical protein [Deferribacteraceae bacterium]
MKQIAFLIICFTAVASVCYSWGTLTVFAGEKFLDSKQWKPADEHFLKAIRFDIGDPTQFANISLDYYASDYNKMTFENNALTNILAKTEEIRIGLRGYYGQKVRFFGAGGIANITSSLSKQTAQGESVCSGSTGYNFFSNGVWFEAGMDYSLSNMFIAGLSGSYSDGRIKCGGKNFQVGGANAGAYFGISF